MDEIYEVVDEVVEESTETKGSIAPVILGGAALLTCVVTGTMYLVKKLKNKKGKKSVVEGSTSETEDTDEFLDEDIAEEDV